jgi:hypothetical protein
MDRSARETRRDQLDPATIEDHVIGGGRDSDGPAEVMDHPHTRTSDSVHSTMTSDLLEPRPSRVRPDSGSECKSACIEVIMAIPSRDRRHESTAIRSEVVVARRADCRDA